MYNAHAMALLNELCERLEVKAENVRSVTITPHGISVEMFVLNEKGEKQTSEAPRLIATKSELLPFEYV